MLLLLNVVKKEVIMFLDEENGIWLFLFVFEEGKVVDLCFLGVKMKVYFYFFEVKVVLLFDVVVEEVVGFFFWLMEKVLLKISMLKFL